MKNIKSIVFDYDGTLHDSIKIYAPAFRKAYAYLVQKGYGKQRIWKDEEISKWLGYSSKAMWESFMPHLPEEEKKICSKLIGETMLGYLDEGKAELYEGALEVLESLKVAGLDLIFLSNCKISYMEAHKRIFHLEKYFDAFYCSEAFGFIPKYEIFNRIKEDFEGDFIVVGDRDVDMELAKHHKLYAIGCDYGFGTEEELETADMRVQNVMQIREAILKLIK